MGTRDISSLAVGEISADLPLLLPSGQHLRDQLHFTVCGGQHGDRRFDVV